MVALVVTGAVNVGADRRAALLTGLALAAAVAAWWLATTRLAIDRGDDTVRAASLALTALWLLRCLALSLVTVRMGALQGGRAGAVTGLLLVAPAWPLVALLWAAGRAPTTALLFAEAGLMLAAGLLPWLGEGLRRLLPRPGVADGVAAGLGVSLAAACWYWRGPLLAALA